jgi:hypothetical protein
MTPEFYDRWKAVLSSARWKALRARLIRERGDRCERCRKQWAPGYKHVLILHHLTYERLGAERDTDVQLVCEYCHDHADRERADAGRQRSWNARLDAWATKVYGENWDPGDGSIEEHFEAWLEDQ